MLPQKCSMKSQMASKWHSAFILVDYGISQLLTWLIIFPPCFQHTVVSVFPSSSIVVGLTCWLLFISLTPEFWKGPRLNPGTYLNLHLFPWWLYLVLYSVFQYPRYSGIKTSISGLDFSHESQPHLPVYISNFTCTK